MEIFEQTNKRIDNLNKIKRHFFRNSESVKVLTKSDKMIFSNN